MITPDQLTKAANDLRLALGLNHEEAEPILRHLQRLVEQERKRAADIAWKIQMEHFGGGTAIGNAIMDDGKETGGPNADLGAPIIPLTQSQREELGSIVRLACVRWAETQLNPKDSWLVPYQNLSESDKEADRQIGESLYYHFAVNGLPKWPVGGDPELEHFGGGTAMVSRGVPLEACEAMSDTRSSTRLREQRDEALAEAERLSRSDETFRRLWNDLSSGTDGNNWYWLEYGEKCYAYAVVSAITENERDEKRTPPPGTKLEPTDGGGWVWKGLGGVRMVSDENITFIERQDGGVICRFIAGSFAYAKERFGNMAAAGRTPSPVSHAELCAHIDQLQKQLTGACSEVELLRRQCKLFEIVADTYLLTIHQVRNALHIGDEGDIVAASESLMKKLADEHAGELKEQLAAPSATDCSTLSERPL